MIARRSPGCGNRPPGCGKWPTRVSAQSAFILPADPTKPVGKRYNLSSRDSASPTGDSRAWSLWINAGAADRRQRQPDPLHSFANCSPNGTGSRAGFQDRRQKTPCVEIGSVTHGHPAILADAQNIPWQKNRPCSGSHAPRPPASKTGRGHRMHPQSKCPRCGGRYLSGTQHGFASTLPAVRYRHPANSLSGDAVHGASPGEAPRKNHPRGSGYPGGTPMLSGHQPRLGQYNTGVSEERLSSIGYPGRESGKSRLCRSSGMPPNGFSTPDRTGGRSDEGLARGIARAPDRDPLQGDTRLSSRPVKRRSSMVGTIIRRRVREHYPGTHPRTLDFPDSPFHCSQHSDFRPVPLAGCAGHQEDCPGTGSLTPPAPDAGAERRFAGRCFFRTTVPRIDRNARLVMPRTGSGRCSRRSCGSRRTGSASLVRPR